MPYGFNEDKSKYDLGDIGSIVVLENNSVITVDGAPHRRGVAYSPSDLSDLGIDDISDWVVIGKMFSYSKDNDTKTNYWKTHYDASTLFVEDRVSAPEGIIVKFQPSAPVDKLVIQVLDAFQEDVPIHYWYRVVLMKVK